MTIKSITLSKDEALNLMRLHHVVQDAERRRAEYMQVLFEVYDVDPNLAERFDVDRGLLILKETVDAK